MALSYGIFLAPFAEYADPKRLVALAVMAEEAGWDGVFLWDHVLEGTGLSVADSFVMTSAIAQATERVRLGMLVTPLARRRPWVFARQSASLDQLSGGRLVVGVGLGHDSRGELSSFSGEVLDARQRAEVLDESLEVLVRFWSGEPVEFEGRHIQVHSASFLPRPVQRPVPIWVACRAPYRRPLVRAARYQGCFPIFDMGERTIPAPPEAAQVASIARRAPRKRSPARHRCHMPGRLGPPASKRARRASPRARGRGDDMVARILRPRRRPLRGRDGRCWRASPLIARLKSAS